LQGLVADEIEKCKVGMDLNGFGLRKPGDVFASNYATAIEKAYLFYHILKHFNIPAEITALPIDNQGAKDVPTLLQFDGYLIKIKKKADSPVFLNPWENGEHLFAYKKGGAAVFNLQQKAFQVLKGYSAEESGVKISGKIDLCTCKKGSGGELTVSLKGHFYPHRSMLKDSKAALMKAVKDVLPVSELEVKRIVLLTPWKVTAVVGVKGKFLKEIYGQRFLLPKYKFPNVKDEIISLTDREYPMLLDVPFYSGVNLEFRVAKGLEVSYLAPSVVVKDGLGLYKQEVKLSKEGVIKLKMGLGIKKSLIEPGDYSAFKKVLNKYFIKEPLVVVKKIK
ncbi:MAG: hypothetical protein GY950_03135, partial [bacterium]|nr:hypothetical protein [bacterium]